MENNRFVKMLRKKGTIKSRVRWKNRKNRKQQMKTKMIGKVNKKERISRNNSKIKTNRVRLINQTRRNRIIRRATELKVIKKHHYLRKVKIIAYQDFKVHQLPRKTLLKQRNRRKTLKRRNLIFARDQRFPTALATMKITMRTTTRNTKKMRKYVSVARDS